MGVNLCMELNGVKGDHSPGWNKEICKNLWTLEDTGTFPADTKNWHPSDGVDLATVYYAIHIPKLEEFAAECRTRAYEHGAVFYEKMIGEIRARGEVKVWQHW